MISDGICCLDVQVCENGLLLMDRVESIPIPQAFRADWSPQPTVFAPYWCLTDNTASPHANVWYHVFGEATRTSPQHDFQTISAIDSLVTLKFYQNSSAKFRSKWSLLVTWQRMSSPQNSAARRQLQVIRQHPRYYCTHHLFHLTPDFQRQIGAHQGSLEGRVET